MVICLQRGADMHMAQLMPLPLTVFCFSEIQIGTFLVPAASVKLKDRLPSKELRERLGVDDIALVLQQNRLRWYGHCLLLQ